MLALQECSSALSSQSAKFQVLGLRIRVSRGQGEISSRLLSAEN